MRSLLRKFAPFLYSTGLAKRSYESLKQEIINSTWWYDFELPCGTKLKSAAEPAEVNNGHYTRLKMLEEALEEDLADKENIAQSTYLEFASHQGWFATTMAKKGFRRCLGLEVRDRHIHMSTIMAQALGIQNLEFQKADIFKLDPEEFGQWDYLTMFGLLYHVEDPVGALRLAYALTRKKFVIETQVGPNIEGEIDWGHHTYRKKLYGAFTLVDEHDDLENPEASVTGICMVPSIEGLIWVMQKVGFRNVRLIEPPEDAYEQLAKKVRVVVVGEK